MRNEAERAGKMERKPITSQDLVLTLLGCSQLWIYFRSFLGTPSLEDVPQPHLICPQIAFKFHLQDFPISRMPGLPGWVLLKKELWFSFLTTSFSGSFQFREG